MSSQSTLPVRLRIRYTPCSPSGSWYYTRSPLVDERRISSAIRRRVALFRQGDYATLLTELNNATKLPQHSIETRVAKRARAEPSAVLDAGVRRARNLVREGAPAKPLQLLLSDGTHRSSDPAVWSYL